MSLAARWPTARADVAAVADRLGIERFFTVGWSGGGPHALASAALLPDRVIAAATLSSPGTRHGEGLDWLSGMGAENLEEFGAADAGEDQLEAYLAQNARELANASGPDLHAALGDLLSDVDRGVLTGEFADYLAACTRAGLENGFWGWFDDDLAFVRDWGFELGAISAPVAIWHGGQAGSCPSPTALGWRTTSAAHARTCTPSTATSRSRSGPTARCWTTSSPSLRRELAGSRRTRTGG